MRLHAIVLAFVATPAFAANNPASFESHVRPFLQEYCVACHGPDKEKGGVRVDVLGPFHQTPEFANTWVEVRDNLLHLEMPPEDKTQPSDQLRAAVVAWINNELEEARKASAGTGGKIVLRRLNRSEYRETVRELLHLHPAVDAAANFPDDDTFHGFDNIGSALNISPVQMRVYVENAANVLNLAFPKGKEPTPELSRMVTMEAEDFYRASDRVSEWKRETNGKVIPKAELERQEREVMATVPKIDQSSIIGFGVVGQKEYLPDGVVFPNQAQVRWSGRPAGIYKFRFHVKGVPNQDGDLPMMAVSLTAQPPNENQTVQTTDLTGEFKTYEMEAFAQSHAASLKFEVAAMGNRNFYRRGVAMPRIQVQWVEIEGPIVGQWPSPAWHAYFGGVEDGDTGARTVLGGFAEKAFRRPPDPVRLEQFVAFYQQRRTAGDDFETAVKLSMQGILASPEFIFMPEAKDSPDGKRQPIDDYELATRLSYFLWSGPPDAELYGLAKAGKLRASLDAQVRRMIAHPRAARFAENFTGQWLKLRTLGQMAPDPNKFVEWEGTLQDSMRRETEQFFLHILQNDLSIAQFIDSDFAMLNGRLAYFYGIEGVTGYDLRPVSLENHPQRGGLLGQGSILTLTSDGIRTSPVKRGAFILENILGSPPPPPPNDVPPVSESTGSTLKERLKSHREMAACAECHNTIDPPGFALENFNAIGKWREKEEDTKLPVDPSGEMKALGSFDDFPGFKKLLAARTDQVTKCLAEKLLLYALGRPLDFTDDAVIQNLTKQTQAGGGQLSSLVLGITRSEPFLTK